LTTTSRSGFFARVGTAGLAATSASLFSDTQPASAARGGYLATTVYPEAISGFWAAQLAAAGTFVAGNDVTLNWNSVLIDTLGAAALTTSRGYRDRLFVPQAGLYEVRVMLGMDWARSQATGKIASGGIISWGVTKNAKGLIHYGDAVSFTNVIGANDFDALGFCGASGPIPCSQGDYLQLHLFQANENATMVGERGGISSTTTSFAITHDSSAFRVGDLIWFLDTPPPLEAAWVTGTGSNPPSLRVTRGALGTNPLDHAQSAIINRGAPWTAGTHPGIYTTLAASIGSTDGGIAPNLADPGPYWGIVANDYIQVDQEIMLVTANAPGLTTPFSLLYNSYGVRRGQLGTKAVAHNAGAAVYTGRLIAGGVGGTMFSLGFLG
jgi:hypothetical protein